MDDCEKCDKNSLVYAAVNEMEEYSGLNIDCWLTRIKKIESLCNIKTMSGYTKPDIVRNNIKKPCSQYSTGSI